MQPPHPPKISLQKANDPSDGTSHLIAEWPLCRGPDSVSRAGLTREDQGGRKSPKQELMSIIVLGKNKPHLKSHRIPKQLR